MELVIYIEPLAAMQNKLVENRNGVRGLNFEESVSIPRFPRSLTEITATAIAPEMVSIGPYHYNSKAEFDNYKWWSLNRLISRLNNRRARGPDLHVLYEATQQLEENARKCYEESISTMTSSQFVEMMVLDGCFVIELLRAGGARKEIDVVADDQDGDFIFSKPGLIQTITGDLLKLENQLPFFVLERLFSLSSDPDTEEDHLQLLALKFFNDSFFPRSHEEVLARSNVNELPDVKHLLHLFYSSFCRFLTPKPEPNEPQMLVIQERRRIRNLFKYLANQASRVLEICRPSGGSFIAATDLVVFFIEMVVGMAFLALRMVFIQRPDEYRPSSDSIECVADLRSAGIEFVALRADSFLPIFFHIPREVPTAILKIPPIIIDDLTITILVNSIALEQFNCQITPWFFTTYIAFMSCLVRSSKDVAILSASGILTSSFLHNDHDVAGLFKKLGEKVYFNKKDCYLSKTFRDVEAYYKSPLAGLRRTHFSRPWSIISFLSAMILLLLTIGQTVVAILAYKN